MAEEDDLQLQEALRRSLEQTNLQESQLADALAESVRTRDHEIAHHMHRDQLAKIEQDLMSQDTPYRGEASRYIEAELLGNNSTAQSKEEEWQVVGDQNLNRPRYVPLNFHKGCADNPNAREQCNETPGSPSHPKHNRVSFSQRNIPYRPPNMHVSASSSISTSDRTLPTRLSPSLDPAANGSAPVSTPAIPRYRPTITYQAGIGRRAGAVSTANEPLVVIDGQNVGCSFGAGGVSRFRARGVEVVLDFYFNKGIPAVAMIPRNKVDTRSNIPNDRVADDPDLLKKLEDQGRLAFTPAGAHDDHFLLSYAMNKGIDIISNDRFQKEVAEQETHTDARKLRNFLHEHLIPYTFVHGEFIPNPKQSQLGRSIHHSRARR